MTTKTATVAESVAAVIPGGNQVGAVWQPSTGPIGASRTSDHQYSFSGYGPVPGVTGILDVVEKPALRRWFGGVIAGIAVEQYDRLGTIIADQGAAAAIEWLKTLPDYQRNSAASLGTAVHHLADLLGRDRTPADGFQVTEQALPYAQAVARFYDDYGASNIVSSEKMVINFSEAYGGQFDMILRVNDELWLVDWKASKGIYPETGMQLAAYQHAEYIMLPNDPELYPMPQVERCGVVHIAPTQYEKGYRFVEYQVRDTDYRAFLSARNLWEWRKEGRFRQRELTTVPAVSGIQT